MAPAHEGWIVPADSTMAGESDGAFTVDALLARYPGPVSIHPDVNKLSGLMIIAAVFVIVCAWGVLHYAPLSGVRTILLTLSGAYFAGQFVGLARLLSGGPLLTLRNDGLFVTNGFRRWDFSWNEVGESVVLRYGLYAWWSFAGIKYRKRPDEKPPFSSTIRLPKVQPMKPEQLVQLVNRWRAMALGQAVRA